MKDSTAINVGFLGLLTGMAILLSGVWMDGEMALVIGGAAVVMTSVMGFVIALSGDEPQGASAH